jgi:protein-arginine kinase activator protein McsA
MLTPEQVKQLKDLVTEGKRLVEGGDYQGAAAIQQRIEALKSEWRNLN